MKRLILIVFAVLLAVTFAVNAEAKDRRYKHHNRHNEGGSNTIIVPLFPIPIPVPVIPDNGGYYDNYYGGQRYYRNNRCGWIDVYEYDFYGEIIHYKKYHCQGQRD